MSRTLTALAAACVAVFGLIDTTGAQQRVSDPPMRVAGTDATAQDVDGEPGPAQEAIAVPPPQEDDPGGGGQGRQTEEEDPVPPSPEDDPGGGAQGRQTDGDDPVPPPQEEDPTPPSQENDPGGGGQGRQTQEMGTVPQHGGGDPGGGGQGRQNLAAIAVNPDLLLVSDFQLATATIPWGNSATVSAGDASLAQHGHCGFRYKYVTRNQGGGGAGASTNRIRRDTQSGQVVASNPLPALAPAATSVSDGHVWLKPGTWMLYVHADEPQLVVESDEKNNLRRVRVTVEGDCG